MAWRGRLQLGDTLDLMLVTRNAAKKAVLPEHPPQVKVWKGATRVAFAEMPVMDRYTEPGAFYYGLHLGSDYSVGFYQVNYWWLAGSYEGMETDYFEVVAGGHEAGQTYALHFFSCPHADFIVRQLEIGEITAGRNPQVT